MTSVWFFPMVPGAVTALSAAIVAKVVDTGRATQARCFFGLSYSPLAASTDKL